MTQDEQKRQKIMERMREHLVPVLEHCRGGGWPLPAKNLLVLLIPARTDTAYFHDYIYQKPNVEIRFLRGRLKFGDGKNSAPFPSMVVIFH